MKMSDEEFDKILKDIVRLLNVLREPPKQIRERDGKR